MPASPSAAPIELLSGFESTYMPAHDRDVTETTEHDRRWRADLALLRGCGVTRLRYPVRWHRVEPEPGTFDWAATDAVLGHLRDTGMRPIVDLVHHTSYPRWVGDFADPGWGPAFLRFAEAFATRYPWVDGYTLFNEPFTTFFLCGHEGLWAPFLRALRGFVTLARNVLPALTAASRMYRELLPNARHLYVDTCERASATRFDGRAATAYANDRRFLVTDLFLGREIDDRRPFAADVRRAGGGDLFEIEPGSIDVLGLDYYAHNQWQYGGPRRAVSSSPRPAPLSELIVEYWERYRMPCMLAETNIRGFATDRASWLKYTLEQCELARDAGVAMDGHCWFPFVDSADWGSLLSRAEGAVDPVGVYWLDARWERHPSSMSDAFRLAASGAPASSLPAYRFRPPVSEWLRGWLPHMAQWDWQDPPPAERCSQTALPGDRIELRIADGLA
ncbi:MAG: family 1 glycosylhydrolase [Acidimicrobiales bacterium]